jgi:hypothetical protein
MTTPAVLSVADTSSLQAALESLRTKSSIWSDLVLNRRAERRNKEWLSAKGIQHPHIGFAWDGDDNATGDWYPQGITGLRSSSSASEEKYILVSWYGKESAAHKGARISFIDVGDMDNIKYRHVLLVEPSNDDLVYKPVEIHAGGLASLGNTIYVADTHLGVRTFDASRIFSAEPDPSKSKCGVLNGYAYGFDYGYILPQSSAYSMTMSADDGRQGFSYLSMDWTDSNRPTLLTGNYHRENDEKYHNPPPKNVWWNMAGNRITSARNSLIHCKLQIQGTASFGGSVWLSRSGSEATRALIKIALTTGRSKEFTWPYGCEDLHFSPISKNIWCLTEHPDKRFVFAVKSEEYQ